MRSDSTLRPCRTAVHLSFSAGMSHGAIASRSDSGLDRAWLALACAIPVVWFFVFDRAQTDFLVDESGHLGNVYHFLEGKPGWPEQMTMLPGYHFIVAALWQLQPPFGLLTLARLIPTVCMVLATLSFACTWRRLHALHGETGAGRAALLLALLPILQPFSALAYTDVPAIAFVLVAFQAQVAGQRTLALVLFIGAACLRQTNLLWAAFAVTWEFVRSDVPRRTFFPRAGALLVLLGTAAGLVLSAGRTTVGTQTGTALSFNPAVLHCAALLFLLLAFPAWLRFDRGAVARAIATWRARPIPTCVGLALGTGLVVVLARGFANPHVWNRELFWEGSRFTLLRNWPLVWIETHPALRWFSAVNLVLMVVVIALGLRHQPHRAALLFVLSFGAALPLANNLVEPRYFIPGAVFALLFLRLDAGTMRRLAAAWALMVVAHAPFVAQGLSLW